MINKLKIRWTKDGKYPINVFDEEYWDFFLDLYGVKKSWEDLIHGIERDYQGDPGLFLEDFYLRRDKMLKSIKETPEMEKFNAPWKKDLEPSKDNPLSPFYDLPEEFKKIRRGNIYNPEFQDKWFYSIDLKKANLQAMNFFNRCWFTGKKLIEGTYLSEDLYKEWLTGFEEPGKECLNSYIRNSKYVREVIFGNLNPDRQIRIERYLLSRVALCLPEKLRENLVQFGNDELLIEVDRSDFEFPEIDQKEEVFIDIREELFQLKKIPLLTPSGADIDSWYRLRTDGSYDFKGVNKHFFAQVYEYMNNIDPDPEERDLLFYCEKDLAKFMKRLKPYN